MSVTITNTFPLDPGHLRPRDGWATAQATIRDLERDAFARMMETPYSGEQAPAVGPGLAAPATGSSLASPKDSGDGHVDSAGARPPAATEVAQRVESGAKSSQWAHAIESETPRGMPTLGLPLPTPIRVSSVTANATASTQVSARAPVQEPDPARLHVAIIDGRAEIAVRANASESVLGARLLAVLDELGLQPSVIKVNGIVNGRSDKGASDGN